MVLHPYISRSDKQKLSVLVRHSRQAETLPVFYCSDALKIKLEWAEFCSLTKSIIDAEHETDIKVHHQALLPVVSQQPL